MTEAMPFLRNTILLSYDTRSFPGGLLIVRNLFQLFPPLLAWNTAVRSRTAFRALQRRYSPGSDPLQAIPRFPVW